MNMFGIVQGGGGGLEFESGSLAKWETINPENASMSRYVIRQHLHLWRRKRQYGSSS